jgi:hypothetical protein
VRERIASACEVDLAAEAYRSRSRRDRTRAIEVAEIAGFDAEERRAGRARRDRRVADLQRGDAATAATAHLHARLIGRKKTRHEGGRFDIETSMKSNRGDECGEADEGTDPQKDSGNHRAHDNANGDFADEIFGKPHEQRDGASDDHERRTDECYAIIMMESVDKE